MDDQDFLDFDSLLNADEFFVDDPPPVAARTADAPLETQENAVSTAAPNLEEDWMTGLLMESVNSAATEENANVVAQSGFQIAYQEPARLKANTAVAPSQFRKRQLIAANSSGSCFVQLRNLREAALGIRFYGIHDCASLIPLPLLFQDRPTPETFATIASASSWKTGFVIPLLKPDGDSTSGRRRLRSATVGVGSGMVQWHPSGKQLVIMDESNGMWIWKRLHWNQWSWNRFLRLPTTQGVVCFQWLQSRRAHYLSTTVAADPSKNTMEILYEKHVRGPLIQSGALGFALITGCGHLCLYFEQEGVTDSRLTMVRHLLPCLRGNGAQITHADIGLGISETSWVAYTTLQHPDRVYLVRLHLRPVQDSPDFEVLPYLPIQTTPVNPDDPLMILFVKFIPHSFHGNIKLFVIGWLPQSGRLLILRCSFSQKAQQWQLERQIYAELPSPPVSVDYVPTILTNSLSEGFVIVCENAEIWRISYHMEMQQVAAGFGEGQKKTVSCAAASITGVLLTLASSDDTNEQVFFRPFIVQKLPKTAVDWVSKYIAFSLLNDDEIPGSNIFAPLADYIRFLIPLSFTTYLQSVSPPVKDSLHRLPFMLRPFITPPLSEKMFINGSSSHMLKLYSVAFSVYSSCRTSTEQFSMHRSLIYLLMNLHWMREYISSSVINLQATFENIYSFLRANSGPNVIEPPPSPNTTIRDIQFRHERLVHLISLSMWFCDTMSLIFKRIFVELNAKTNQPKQPQVHSLLFHQWFRRTVLEISLLVRGLQNHVMSQLDDLTKKEHDGKRTQKWLLRYLFIALSRNRLRLDGVCKLMFDIDKILNFQFHNFDSELQKSTFFALSDLHISHQWSLLTTQNILDYMILFMVPKESIGVSLINKYQQKPSIFDDLLKTKLKPIFDGYFLGNAMKLFPQRQAPTITSGLFSTPGSAAFGHTDVESLWLNLTSENFLSGSDYFASHQANLQATPESLQNRLSQVLFKEGWKKICLGKHTDVLTHIPLMGLPDLQSMENHNEDGGPLLAMQCLACRMYHRQPFFMDDEDLIGKLVDPSAKIQRSWRNGLTHDNCLCGGEWQIVGVSGEIGSVESSALVNSILGDEAMTMDGKSTVRGGSSLYGLL